MSLYNSSAIVTNGLVFAYDMYNLKSYVSPPIRNVLTGINPRGQGTNQYYQFSNGTENVYIPNLGFIQNCPYMDMYNDYNGGSNNCCPSPYGYGDSLTVTGSTLYTYAIVYKSVNGYTNGNYMYHYEFTSGGSYLTEYGVFGNNGSTAKIRPLGDDWYWASSTFTSNASAGLMNTGSWMYEYGRYNRFYVAKAMLVPGNYIDMHPSEWPPLNTTVSATQSLRDLTNNNTLTVNNLSYSTDGGFSFNGSNSVITAPNNTIFDTQTPTVEVWIKTNALSQNGFFFEKGTVNTQYSLFQEGSNIVWRQGGNSQYTTTANYINTSNWAHIVGTFTTGSRNTYINGVLVTSDNLSATVGVNSNGITIGSYNSGGYFYNGSIGSVRVYNRALTASEVAQNFQAQRSLYGV
jgi:hypothetical protein